MITFVMLTRLEPTALKSPGSLQPLEQEVMRRIRAECSGVEWRRSLAVLGPVDYLDIFEAPDVDTAMKVAAIVRTFGHATTEVWTAMDWKHFKTLVEPLPTAEGDWP